MNQKSFSDIEYGLRKRTTKREEFLKTLDGFISWDEWAAFLSKRSARTPTLGD
jgi:IS5 family transposase